MASQKQTPFGVAKVLDTLERIPEVYREFFEPYHSAGETLPYAVLTPAYKAPGETITAKLVCVIDHTFYVLEEKDNSLTKVSYPIDEINYVEVIHRPADMIVKINGFTNLGLLTTSVFGCDKTTDNILAPLFRPIRLRIDSLNEKAPSRRMERLDRWKELNAQVIDMARHCLMTGETVIESVLQPEIRPSIFSLDKVLRGDRSPTHICILTDKELVMIREDPSLGKKDQYGGVCNFIPLNKIHSLVTSQKGDDLLVVSTSIAGGNTFESLFDLSIQNDVNRFLDRTREFIPKERTYRRDASTVSG